MGSLWKIINKRGGVENRKYTLATTTTTITITTKRQKKKKRKKTLAKTFNTTEKIL